MSIFDPFSTRPAQIIHGQGAFGRLLAPVGLILLLVFCASEATAQSNTSASSPPHTVGKSGDSGTLGEHKADLRVLRERIEALRKELTEAEGSQTEGRDQLRESERAISMQQRELNKLAREKAALQLQIADLNIQQKNLEKTLDEQRRQIHQLLRHQYTHSETDALRLMLNGDDPNQILRDLHYLALVAQSRSTLLKSISGNLREKLALSITARQRALDLGDIEKQQREAYTQLLAQNDERKQLFARLSQQIQQQRKEIGVLQQDERRLSRLIERLGRIIASPPRKNPPAASEEPVPFIPENAKFGELKGQLLAPTKGSVAHRFGTQRDEGSTWKGVFIRTPEGSEVKAIAAGRVVFAEWMRGFGNLTILDHGDNYLSIYGYNEALLKDVGDVVKSGETIARVGNSGGYPEFGLYFEIRHEGEPLDPLKWISFR